MLICGCGDVKCKYKLCKSCPTSKKVDAKMASAVAVSLASRPGVMLCPAVKEMKREEMEVLITHALNDQSVSEDKNVSSSFLSRMISFTSLSHIFNPVSDSSTLSSKQKNNSNPDLTRSQFSQKDVRKSKEIMLPIDKNHPKKAITHLLKTPDYLNYSNWQQMVSECKNLGNIEALVNCLNTVYSSRTRLGCSFLKDIKNKSSPLDLSALEYFYGTVYQLV
jgi:hypothetical protein